MITQHPRYDLVRGDTWKIYGKMLDDRNMVLDITSLASSIKWALASANGASRVIDTDDVDVTVIDADQGDFLISVDEAVTATVPPGRYTDFCWIDLVDGRRTKWTGEIFVHAGAPPP